MKQIKKLSLATLTLLLLATACKKAEEPLKLPPITEEGNDTFACLVDSEVWQWAPGGWMSGNWPGGDLYK